MKIHNLFSQINSRCKRFHFVARFVIGLVIFSLGAITPLSASAAESVFFYHNDAVGSPVAMTDINGTVVWNADYKPFGELSGLFEDVSNKHWFIGKEYELDTGLYYFGARFYDGGIGRFLSVDPALQAGIPFVAVNHPQLLNQYAYGANNPYRFVDPDGEFIQIVAVGVIAIGGAIFNQALNPSPANAPGFGDVLQNAQTSGEVIVNNAIGAGGGVAASIGGKIVGKTAVSVTGKVVGKSAKRKAVVIGENMKDRVIPTAKNRGAEYYKPRKTKSDPLKKNERWIDEKMREGRKVIDIGPDPKRSKRSPFYKAEKRRIERRKYPVSK